jgi:RND family efflux transporter MFP subunit
MGNAPRSRVIPYVVTAGVLAVLATTIALVHRAESRVNKVSLSATARPVTVIAARATTYRESRTYVGTLRPWIEADVGPQFLSAYVDTVLVRPGATVKRGEVLATMDCRNATAASQAVAAEARAIDTRQRAVAHEAARVQSLLDGGYVSPNEAEMKAAQSASEEAQLAAQRAKLAATSLEVNDCILRAPFDGEVATRTIDPGAFVRPGTPVVSVVDRNTIRMTFDVPESDFDVVTPGAPVKILVVATGKTINGGISRRSPSADPDTRTVHVEVDLADRERAIPVNTTGQATIEVGEPAPATAVPLPAASITGSQAAVFVVEGGVARKKTFPVLGERGSDVYLAGDLKPRTLVITEGRFALANGDAVAAHEVQYASASASELSSSSSALIGKPEARP